MVFIVAIWQYKTWEKLKNYESKSVFLGHLQSEPDSEVMHICDKDLEIIENRIRIILQTESKNKHTMYYNSLEKIGKLFNEFYLTEEYKNKEKE